MTNQNNFVITNFEALFKGLFFALSQIGAFFIIWGLNFYLPDILIDPIAWIAVGVLIMTPQAIMWGRFDNKRVVIETTLINPDQETK